MSFERSQSRTMSPSILELGPGPFSNCARVSHVAQSVKNLPAMQETEVQSLGWEDPLGSEELDMTEGLTLGTKEV